MKGNISAKEGDKKSKRRKGARRIQTDRRNKSRWDPQDEDRRDGFGRRRQDKAWDRINSKFD